MSLTSFCAAESFQALALFDRLARPARRLLSLRPLIVRASRRKRLMKYPFVPISERKTLRWPKGKQLEEKINKNLKQMKRRKRPNRSTPGGPGIVGGDLPGDVYDNPNWTWREYGQRVGVWRMFDIFDQFGVPSTCTMNAKMGLERRAVIEAVLKRGWEIVAHNYVQTELLADYSFDESKEREVIRETLRVYKQVCGKPAKGWLSSSLRCTLNTVDILAEEGLIFTADLLNDDQPYLIETRSGRKIVSIPYTSEVNDFTVFLRQGQDVDGAFNVFKEQFDWLYRESAISGRFMNIGLHPHVIGQAFRIRALQDFVAYAKSFSDVWFATREEIAEWYLKNHHTHI
jgi:peptidoglycan/xylan/chitin deacetylase (PgdA/CDA1 family)